MSAAESARQPATGVPEERLHGVWHLVSYVDLDPTGGDREGPLGPAPEGVLIYTADGHMSVSMMRTGAVPEDTTGRQVETFMGYAGRWRLAGGEVRHAVRVSAHPHMVGTELVRRATLDGDLLVLHGTSIIDGIPRHRVLTWRRA